ncbi:hypothetical protein LSM04_005999 [Trypanosoma melophagium]|uniref:uncharacterized protein n=1 Tax=Trypanosoma melophagium TaxID=715481 RepID=UPI00351A4467|nr:hypothetical protein LSM04_005999 [Trypanosoma melophagium]
MGYSIAQRLARLHAIDTATEAMEQQIEQLTAVIGRRSDGWREADAELKALRQRMLTQCCAEVRELTVYGQSEEKQKEELRPPCVWSSGSGGKLRNIGKNDSNTTNMEKSFSVSNSSDCSFEENESIGSRRKLGQMEQRSVPLSYSSMVDGKEPKKEEPTIRRINPMK